MNVLAGPKRRLSGDVRQQQIVETVLDLIAERGADDVSVQAISDRIGLTQPAVFRHFPNKEAIWVAVMEWLEERLGRMYRSAQTEFAESAITVLDHIFIEHMRMIERHPALAKVVFSDHLRIQFPSLQARFSRIAEAYRERLSELIERAKAHDLADRSLPTNDAVTLFLCMVQGLGFQFAIARRPMDLSREAQAVFALYLRAIGCPSDLDIHRSSSNERAGHSRKPRKNIRSKE